MKSILAKLGHYSDELESLREIILANAVMFGEIPAPTFKEKARVQFLCDRFNECGLESISVDEEGNGIGIIPGTEGKHNILLVAHLDTVFDAAIPHTVTVEPDKIKGPAISNNSIGVAALASLPTILEKLNIRLKDNLILLGHSKSLGYGDLKGFRFFIEHYPKAIRAAMCISGTDLGRISYTSHGMLRGTIKCGTVETFATPTSTNAISTLASVISDLLAIPLPQQPKTSIILGEIEGGAGFGVPAKHAHLCFEVRSEQVGLVNEIQTHIENIVDKTRYETGSEMKLELIARRTQGGIDYAHPFVTAARNVLDALDVKPAIWPSTGALTALIEKKIPAITIGLTHGNHIGELDESIQIEPIYKGLIQIIAMLQSIDEGYCDVEN